MNNPETNFKHIFIALLLSMIVSVLTAYLVSLVQLNIGRSLFLPFLVLLFSLDVTKRFFPASSWQPMFTNWKDTVVICLGLIVASVLFNLGNIFLPEGVFWTIVTAIISIIATYVIIFVLGSNDLKERLSKKSPEDTPS